MPLESSAAPERHDVLITAPTTRTRAERSVAAAATVLNQPHAMAGQIAANGRDASGRVRRSEVLRWCDNPDGRCHLTVSKQPGTPAVLIVNPTDPPRPAP